MRKTISGFEINSKGFRKEEHPTGFKTILLEIIIKSPDVSESDLEKVSPSPHSSSPRLCGFARDK
jgi:uncharacterized OsmC-like protein